MRLSSAWATACHETHPVVLVDSNRILSNGFGPRVVPWNAMRHLPGAHPAAPDSIGNTDDWAAKYVFTHEYAHILHLDRSRGVGRR